MRMAARDGLGESHADLFSPVGQCCTDANTRLPGFAIVLRHRGRLQNQLRRRISKYTSYLNYRVGAGRDSSAAGDEGMVRLRLSKDSAEAAASRPLPDEYLQEFAATTIQKHIRGYRTRQELKKVRLEGS